MLSSISMRLGPVAIALLFAVACTRGVAFQVELRCQADRDCPSLSACYGGQCRDSCPAACGEGEACLAARCLPVSCGDRPCHSGQACLQGACVAADCASVACQAGQTCAQGACYPTDCAGLACLAGEICWQQDDCRTSLCQGVRCGASETCADGRCVPTVCAGVVCPDGSACEGGRCQEVRCIGVSCGAGTFCADGRCVPQGCQGVRTLCDDGDECTTDTCQPDGTCSHVANTDPCDDRDPFTSPDHCSVITGTCNGVKIIYRSVGPGRATSLAAGAGNPLTIVGKMASFASALPDDVGVGDVVQYDADGDAAVDALAVIHERFSATAFQVVDVSGATPKPTSAADQKWEIFRAYTSASDALAGRGKENPGIASSLLPFETWTRKKDLVAANEQLRIACYADGSDRTAVVVGGDVGSNWVTGPANYIELYTPVSASEVGTSQRHAGRWPIPDFHPIATPSSRTVSLSCLAIRSIRSAAEFSAAATAA